MRNVRLTLVIALAVALMTGLLVAGPAAAYTPDPTFTRVICYYSTRSVEPWEVVLRQLDVKPPNLGKQTPGAKVGWRFVVRRDV